MLSTQNSRKQILNANTYGVSLFELFITCLVMLMPFGAQSNVSHGG